jgi:5-methylcytosine-specific restriction endonuclease McrA
MTKANRQAIFDKYGGRCAYCGIELVKGWHVDELEPIRRKNKLVGGYRDENGDWVERRFVPNGCMHPDRLHLDNQMPACASCNINKHSGSLEEFRSMITGFMKHLNEINTQYKIAKRYGLVIENIKPIVFYFETKQTTTT